MEIFWPLPISTSPAKGREPVCGGLPAFSPEQRSRGSARPVGDGFHGILFSLLIFHSGTEEERRSQIGKRQPRPKLRGHKPGVSAGHRNGIKNGLYKHIVARMKHHGRPEAPGFDAQGIRRKGKCHHHDKKAEQRTGDVPVVIIPVLHARPYTTPQSTSGRR